MSDDLSERQAAIQHRLAGEMIEAICRLIHSEARFRKWWQRHLDTQRQILTIYHKGHQVRTLIYKLHRD